MNERIADMREDYTAGELLESSVNPDPLAQFRTWFDEARNTSIREPNAMTLATVQADGTPSARMVLLKDLDATGFVFYTNRDSSKGAQLAANPCAALCFWWDVLQRQVRVEGQVERVSDDESDAYFASRPRKSQLGAIASPQSQVLQNRSPLEETMARLEAEYPEGTPIPRPTHWGGYRVLPYSIEFWQGRRSRLHDRLLFTREPNGSWSLTRLAP